MPGLGLALTKDRHAARLRLPPRRSQLGHLTTSLSTWAGNDTGSGAAQQQAGPQQAGQQSEQQQQQQADETKQQQQDGSAGSAGAGAGVDEDPFHGKRLDVSGLPSVFNLLTDYPQENSWLAKAAKDKKADL